VLSLRAAIRSFRHSRLAVGGAVIICVVLATIFFQARAASYRRITVTALFAIEPRIPEATQPRGASPKATFGFESFATSQVELLKSASFLKAVVRISNLQSLALLQHVDDPTTWLAKHVRIDFPRDGVLAISMSGANLQRGDLTAIVDAIAQSFNDEFSNQSEMAPAVTRDAMMRSLSGLKAEIKRKQDEFEDINREAGPPKPEDIDPFPTLNSTQLLVAANGIQKILSDLNASTDPHSQSEVDKLRDEQMRYINVVKRRMEGGYSRDVGKRDLEQLQVFADDIEHKLKSFDRYTPNLFHVRQIQSATITFDEP
jgi:hypothetical protein